MRRLLLVSFLLLLASCNEQGGLVTDPTTPQATEAVRKYILQEKECHGTLEIKNLKVISIGEYETQTGGWAVKATCLATCVMPGTDMQYVERNNQEATPYEIYVKDLGDGKYEAFLPDAIKRERERQLKGAKKAIRHHRRH